MIPIDTGKSHLIPLFSKIAKGKDAYTFWWEYINFSKNSSPVAPTVGSSGFSTYLMEEENGNSISEYKFVMCHNQ